MKISYSGKLGVLRMLDLRERDYDHGRSFPERKGNE